MPDKSAGRHFTSLGLYVYGEVELTQHSNCGTTRTPLWRRAPDGRTICNACGLYLKARNTQRPPNMKRLPQTTSLIVNGPTNATNQSTTMTTQSGATYVAADKVASGSCPGGGRCNGTGGAQGCNGCPAYNNRVAKSAQFTVAGAPALDPQLDDAGAGPSESSPAEDADMDQVDMTENAQSNGAAGGDVMTTTAVVACQNCGTTITPLWRRDESGHTICNACGKSHNCSVYSLHPFSTMGHTLSLDFHLLAHPYTMLMFGMCCGVHTCNFLSDLAFSGWHNIRPRLSLRSD